MDRCAKVNGKIHLEFIYNQKGLLKLALPTEISVGKILLAPSLNISGGIVSPEQHSKPHSKPSHLLLTSSTRIPPASVVCWLGSREESYQPELERAFQTTRVLFQYCEGFLELQVRNTEGGTSCLISCKQILSPSLIPPFGTILFGLMKIVKQRKENYQSTGGQAKRRKISGGRGRPTNPAKSDTVVGVESCEAWQPSCSAKQTTAPSRCLIIVTMYFNCIHLLQSLPLGNAYYTCSYITRPLHFSENYILLPRNSLNSFLSISFLILIFKNSFLLSCFSL